MAATARKVHWRLLRPNNEYRNSNGICATSAASAIRGQRSRLSVMDSSLYIAAYCPTMNAMREPPLPNFFVVGAGKAGTTSLYHYLRQHPQIYMSPVK